MQTLPLGALQPHRAHHQGRRPLGPEDPRRPTRRWASWATRTSTREAMAERGRAGRGGVRRPPAAEVERTAALGGRPEADAPTRPRMRMRDLERATGVGRETIRFYIREGLLPEPERPGRNVAWYDASLRRAPPPDPGAAAEALPAAARDQGDRRRRHAAVAGRGAHAARARRPALPRASRRAPRDEPERLGRGGEAYRAPAGRDSARSPQRRCSSIDAARRRRVARGRRGAHLSSCGRRLRRVGFTADARLRAATAPPLRRLRALARARGAADVHAGRDPRQVPTEAGRPHGRGRYHAA